MSKFVNFRIYHVSRQKSIDISPHTAPNRWVSFLPFSRCWGLYFKALIARFRYKLQPLCQKAQFGAFIKCHPIICQYLTSHLSKPLALFCNILGRSIWSFKMLERAFPIHPASAISKGAFFRLHHVSHLILVQIISSLLHQFGNNYAVIWNVWNSVYNTNGSCYVKKCVFQASACSYPKLFISQLSLVQILSPLLHNFKLIQCII